MQDPAIAQLEIFMEGWGGGWARYPTLLGVEGTIPHLVPIICFWLFLEFRKFYSKPFFVEKYFFDWPISQKMSDIITKIQKFALIQGNLAHGSMYAPFLLGKRVLQSLNG